MRYARHWWKIFILESGDAVLEVCVGTGANLPYIAERIGSSGMVAGIDISEGMLTEARKKLAALPCPVALPVGVAEQLPYPDETFDAVLTLDALNFITDRKRAIDEMVRVAKPSAYLIAGDETLAPDGLLCGLLSRGVQALVPRLRPPLELVAGSDVRVSYVLPSQGRPLPRCPHARGGEPSLRHPALAALWLSPRTWG